VHGGEGVEGEKKTLLPFPKTFSVGHSGILPSGGGVGHVGGEEKEYQEITGVEETRPGTHTAYKSRESFSRSLLLHLTEGSGDGRQGGRG